MNKVVHGCYVAAHYAAFCITSLLGDLKEAYVPPGSLRVDIGLEATHLSRLSYKQPNRRLLRAHLVQHYKSAFPGFGSNPFAQIDFSS